LCKNYESKPERDKFMGILTVPGQPTDQLTAAAHVAQGQAAWLTNGGDTNIPPVPKVDFLHS